MGDTVQPGAVAELGAKPSEAMSRATPSGAGQLAGFTN